jgi:hypothetical protein
MISERDLGCQSSRLMCERHTHSLLPLSEHDFPHVKRLGHSFRGIASDAAQPGHCDKCLIFEPTSSSLAHKMVRDRVNLPLQLCSRQSYEEIGVTKITVVFRNFVFEHEVIAKGVESKLG